jgi:hypothetical protein
MADIQVREDRGEGMDGVTIPGATKIETVEPKPEPISPARRIRWVKQQNWVNG